MKVKHAAVVCAFLLFPMSAVFGQERCPPPPCDLKTDGRAKCEATADWVIEGKLGSVTDVHERTCKICEPKVRWAGATLILYKPKGVKLAPNAIFTGRITATPYGGTNIVSSSHCWEATTRIDLQAIDKIVRVYGTDEWKSFEFKPGYFAYEVIGEDTSPEK
jgi:hypothetical protein